MSGCVRNVKLRILIRLKMKKQSKVCIVCKIEKQSSDFYIKKDAKDGRDPLCKICRKKRNKNYFILNKKKVLQQQALYYTENKTKINDRNKIYYKPYRLRNKNKIKNKIKEWQIKNKEKIKIYRRYWSKNSRLNNPQFKLRCNISTAISRSLKGNKHGVSWENIVGYSLFELKNHLESQLIDDMSFENYGDWHIDHIKPISSFDFLEPEDEDFKKCWALSNLQPLWAIDNLKKGSTLSDE